MTFCRADQIPDCSTPLLCGPLVINWSPRCPPQTASHCPVGLRRVVPGGRSVPPRDQSDDALLGGVCIWFWYVDPAVPFGLADCACAPGAIATAVRQAAAKAKLVALFSNMTLVSLRFWSCRANGTRPAIVPDAACDKIRARRRSFGAVRQIAGSARPRRRQAAVNVLRNRQAMVIGPTPPGTGVMAPAMPRTAAKSTSPTSRLRPSGPAIGVDPGVDDVAPGFDPVGADHHGRPIAATRMSARRAIAAASSVFEWTVVTVQSAASSNAANRLADDVRAAEHDRLCAGKIRCTVRGSIRGSLAACTARGRGSPAHKPADIDRVKPIDVLFRVDRRHHPMNVDLRRQRQLHQNAVDRARRALSLRDFRDERRSRWRTAAGAARTSQARRRRRRRLGADITAARRVVADQDRGETRGKIMSVAQGRGGGGELAGAVRRRWLCRR